ncbi:glycosyltransferase [Cryobacterium sp. W22_MBD10_FK3]|uniref:glycosyltransferase n=1 Tax=Cryobacterium sp. W22_MBD10_FK3 TaxID=3240273 RepID=UPI003F8EBEF3
MKSTTEETDVRVVHFTESLAAGVLESILRLTVGQAQISSSLQLVHTRRPDTPAPEALGAMFPPAVTRTEIKPSRIPGLELFRLGLRARGILRADPRAIVHVHSSMAGFAVRAINLVGGNNRRIVYSPHGFAFLRQDIWSPVKRFILLMEKILSSRCGGLVLVSQSELDLARSVLSSRQLFLVENAVDLDAVPMVNASRNEPDRDPQDENGQRRLRVVTVGRIARQKAPWKFAALATEFGQADFIWVGDGPTPERDRWLGGSPVAVTGWLPHDQVVEVLLTSDIFVLASLWEGMPMALIEAQCLGLPAIVSNVIGNRDVVIQGVTGVVASTDSSIGLGLRALLGDPTMRSAMALSAVGQRDRFDQSRLGPQTFSIYTEIYARSRGRDFDTSQLAR